MQGDSKICDTYLEFEVSLLVSFYVQMCSPKSYLGMQKVAFRGHHALVSFLAVNSVSGRDTRN